MIYAFQSAAGMARDAVKLKPAALVADAEDLSPELRAALADEGIAAIALEEMGAGAVRGLERSNGAVAAGPPQIEILTSGTTGPPKQFAVPYALIEAHFIDSALARAQGDGAESLPPFLLYFPLGNITGLYTTLPMLLRGQRLVLLERFSLDAWHAYVKRYRPAHSGLPPSFVQQAIDAGIPREDLSSLRALGVGAAPLDPQVQAAFEDRYGVPILISYGATEFAGPVAAMTLELHAAWGRRKLGAVGHALPHVQLRIVDPDSCTVLAEGKEGLLERTADIAVLDADGFLFLSGRADGAIMRGGFKILPESVERALMLHPAVAEAAVTGIADPRLGQVPVALLRLKSRASIPTKESLDAHVRQHVLATHVPVNYLFVDDIPRMPSLKVDRPAVRRLFDAT
jgi:long-chain acyl-CoA synthetase